MTCVLLCGEETRLDAACAGVAAPRVSRKPGLARLQGLSPEAAHALQRACSGPLEALLLPDGLRAGDFKVAVFDMDSTLVADECLDELAAAAGVGEEVAAVTREAMAGRRPFAASLAARVKHLEGADESLWARVEENLRVNDGAQDFIALLRRAGVAAYIASGGFERIARPLAERLGMTGVLCNRLEVRDGRFTGRALGPEGGEILDAAGKRRALERFAALHGAALTETIAVGDGANDLEMIRAAGLGVAYRAKPILRLAADLAVDAGGYRLLQHAFEEAWA